MVDRDAYRDALVRRAAESRVVALIDTYYPPHLKQLVRNCIFGQLRGIRGRGCKSPYCPLCSPRVSKKRENAQYDRFIQFTPQGKPVRLGHHVYTLPPALHHHLWEPDGVARWRSAVRATLREIEGADVAGVMNLHPHGDEDITKLHPHWDVLINGYVLQDGRPVRHKPREIHFDDARAIHKRHLAEAFGTPFEDTREPVLWLGRTSRSTYRTSPYKTRQLVHYSARNIYQPENAWLSDATPQHGDWYYQPKPSTRLRIYHGLDVIRNFHEIDRLLRGKKSRLWFGYMQPRHGSTAVHAFNGGSP